MRSNLKYALLICIALILNQCSCVDQNCEAIYNQFSASHLQRLSTFIQEGFKDSTVNLANMTGELDQFKTRTPQTLTKVTDLGDCQALNTNAQKTCCTANFVTGLKYAVDQFLMQKSKIRPPIYQLIGQFQGKLKSNNCMNTTQKSQLSTKLTEIDGRVKLITSATRRLLQEQYGEDVEEDEFLEQQITQNAKQFFEDNLDVNDKNEDKDHQQKEESVRKLASNNINQPSWSNYKGEVPQMSDYLYKLQVRSLACVAFELIITRRFYLGQTCAYCLNTDTLTTYISSDKVIIKQADYDLYLTGMGQAQKCHQDIANELYTLVKDDDQIFTGQNATSCKNAVNDFKTRVQLTNYNPCSTSTLKSPTVVECQTVCTTASSFLGTDGGCLNKLSNSEASYARRNLQNNHNDLRRNLVANFNTALNGMACQIIDAKAESAVQVGSVTKTGSVDVITYLDSNLYLYSILLTVILSIVTFSI